MDILDKKILLKQQLIQKYRTNENYNSYYFVLDGQVLQNDGYLILCSVLDEICQIDPSKLVHNIEISQFYDANPESLDFSTYHELCAKYSNSVFSIGLNTNKCEICTGSINIYLKTIKENIIQYHRIDIVQVNFDSIQDTNFNKKYGHYAWPDQISNLGQSSGLALGKCQSKQIREITDNKIFCCTKNQYQIKTISDIFKNFKQASIEMQLEQLSNKYLSQDLPNLPNPGLILVAKTVSEFISNAINHSKKNSELFFVMIPFPRLDNICLKPRMNIVVDSFLIAYPSNIVDKISSNIQVESENFGIWTDFVSNIIPLTPKYHIIPNITQFSQQNVSRQFLSAIKKNISLDQTDIIAKIVINGKNHIKKYDSCSEK